MRATTWGRWGACLVVTILAAPTLAQDDPSEVPDEVEAETESESDAEADAQTETDAEPEAAAETDAEAEAEAEEPADGFVQTYKLQARINPVGLSVLTDLGYRILPFEGDGLLTRGTRIDMGVSTRLSPGFVWIGPYIEAVPIAFLKLRASFQPMYYFGAFGFIYDGFASREALWNEQTLDQIDDDGLGEGTFGWQLHLEATLQLKAGPIVALVDNAYSWLWMDVDGDFYYEPFWDILFQDNDAVWWLNATLGYFIGPDPSNWYLIFGPRYARYHSRETDFTRQHIGGMLLWQLPRRWIEWGRPQVVVIVQHYLEHPMRDNEIYGALQIQLTF